MRIYPVTLFFLLLEWPNRLYSPVIIISGGIEICDNSVDDDGDGLIDLNDSDCICPAHPSSLIPNASFEDTICCPNQHGNLDCLWHWQQCSETTTDFLHLCGWLGWQGLPPPLPFPDGQGCVGFRNGRFWYDGTDPGWKEYAGICLPQPLAAAKEYQLQFYLGFVNDTFSPPLEFSLFGTRNCVNIPFGLGNRNFGCPSNDPSWELLGAVKVEGRNGWKKAELKFKSKSEIKALAIGPDCPIAKSNYPLYYFLDQLILAESFEFKFRIKPVGQICSSEFGLTTEGTDGHNLLWYKDGVALPGETGLRLSKLSGPGKYQVRKYTDFGCRITDGFNYDPAPTINQISDSLCLGDTYYFHQKKIKDAGIYDDTLKTQQQCDSIVRLHLSLKEQKTTFSQRWLLPNELLWINHQRFDQPGKYALFYKNNGACDRMEKLEIRSYPIYLPNIFSPNEDGNNDAFEIYFAAPVDEVISFEIIDRWGNPLYQKNNKQQEIKLSWDGRHYGLKAPPGVYVYNLVIKLDDGFIHRTQGNVTLLR